MNAGSSIGLERIRPLITDESWKGSTDGKSRRNTITTEEHRIDNPGVGSSSLPPRTNSFRFRWREELPCADGIYVRRWYLEAPWGSLRVHHWLKSDDTRYRHDHTWWFWTFILKGHYLDVTEHGHEELGPGDLRFRPAHHQHSVVVAPGGCWTILLTGPKIRHFGFQVGKKWKKANKYFLEHGKHICN